MSKIKSKYATKNIDTNLYSEIKINPSSDSETSGVVYVPYVLSEHTEESVEEYNDFMREYHAKHKHCPKCGCTEHTSSLLGYVLYSDRKDEYKDMNRCRCTNCGDTHITHDRK